MPVVATSLRCHWCQNACCCLSTERGRVQRKWVQPESVMFTQSLARSCTSSKIRPNPSKSWQNPSVPKAGKFRLFHTHTHTLSGPISRDTAILSLRYPISRDTFSGRLALPQNGAIPPLVLSYNTGTSVRYPILQHIAR